MVLIPQHELILTENERREHLKFRLEKAQKSLNLERHEYKRKQIVSQIQSLERQIKEINPKVKEEKLSLKEQYALESAFMVEAKHYLLKPMYDAIMGRAWLRLREEQNKKYRKDPT